MKDSTITILSIGETSSQYTAPKYYILPTLPQTTHWRFYTALPVNFHINSINFCSATVGVVVLLHELPDRTLLVVHFDISRYEELNNQASPPACIPGREGE